MNLSEHDQDEIIRGITACLLGEDFSNCVGEKDSLFVAAYILTVEAQFRVREAQEAQELRVAA